MTRVLLIYKNFNRGFLHDSKRTDTGLILAPVNSTFGAVELRVKSGPDRYCKALLPVPVHQTNLWIDPWLNYSRSLYTLLPKKVSKLLYSGEESRNPPRKIDLFSSTPEVDLFLLPQT